MLAFINRKNVLRTEQASGRPAASETSSRAGQAVAAAVAIVPPVIQLVVLFVLPPLRRPLAFSSDDLHYYLLTALNQANGLGSTFDGINRTNGYQPLWFWMLTGAYLPAADRDTALVITMVLLAVLWVVAVVLVYRIATLVVGPGPLPVGLALVALLIQGRWWSGCENALGVVLLLALVLLVLRGGLMSGRPPRPAVAAGVGVLLAALVLTRLDLLVVVAGTALIVLRGVRRSPPRTALATGALIVAPTIVSFGAYLALNHWWFGTALPVSGLAKQLGPAGHNWRVLGDFMLYGQVGPVPLFFGATVLLASAAAVVLLAPGRVHRIGGTRAVHAPALRAMIALLAVTSVVQVVYYAVATSWELQSWYFGAAVVALMLSAVVIGAAIRARVDRGVALATATVVVVVAALGAVALDQTGPLADPPPTATPATRDIDAGAWADANLPPGSVIAMGDWAGTFAYTTSHPVVQTEGLVNSLGYLEALRAGTARAWLADRGVGYLARLTHPGETVGCRVEEPYFGSGPRVAFDVCGRPPLYRGEVTGLGTLYIWALSNDGGS